MNEEQKFSRWFQQTTGSEPFPYQVRFGCGETLPGLVDVPTGELE